MDEQKQKLTDRIRQAQNVLVTVSANPSVDQLAAAIGLTLALNKLDKHATAVFSGEVPSTLEFLKPEDTLEKDTNSLRDFIIALDKSKADKLRYKVEDQVVRIFITPYKTSLSESDLEFSQGDFNIDVVIALGVTEQTDLDAAITAHGRILHDATVASVTTTGQGSLGTINWVNPTASSLSEMVVSLTEGLDKKVFDGQIATALLTGIVASTERFSNEKTTPATMSASAALMAAGANQQLIATQLAGFDASSQGTAGAAAVASDPGTLDIEHESFDAGTFTAPEPPTGTESEHPQIHVDEDGQLHIAGEEPLPAAPAAGASAGAPTALPAEDAGPEVKRGLMMEPPKMGDAAITANSTPEGLEPSTEELTLPAVNSPLLSHNESVLSPLPEPAPLASASPTSIPDPLMTPPPALQPAPAAWQPSAPPDPVAAAPTPSPEPTQSSTPNPFAPQGTLSDIEQSVGSSHVQISEDGILSSVPADAPEPVNAPVADVSNARDAVQAAYNSPGAPADPLQPIAALNAQPLGPDLHAVGTPSANLLPPAPITNTGFSEPTPGNTPADTTLDMPLPSNPFGAGQPQPLSLPQAPPSTFPGAAAPTSDNTQPPPPVPPPMLPPQ